MPHPPHPILDASATSLAAMIRTRDISPTDAVETHIAHIEAVNPSINAVVATRFDEALQEAKNAEALLASTKDPTQLPPFLGVPCTIKEFFAVQGMPQTGGLWARRSHRATEDAILVERLREAGSIILGVTNVPEGGMWLESDNPVFGRTNNPHDLTRTCGGSSGGEAAIVAAGGSAFGLGSDIAGSVRIPAAFCGIFAHKPTNRTLPSLGHFPAGHGTVATYMTGGPMTRSAADLQPLLNILAGPDPRDDNATLKLPPKPPSLDPSKLRVLLVPNHGSLSIDPDLQRALFDAGNAFRERGAKVEEIDIDLFRNSFWIWSAVFAQNSEEPYSVTLGGDTPISTVMELLRYPFTSPRRHTLPALLIALLDEISKLIPISTSSLLRAFDTLQYTIQHLLQPNTILLHPPYTSPSPQHNTPLMRPFDFMCTALFNILGLPVTQVPIRNNTDGLPCGVQIAAASGLDHLTIQSAQILEEEFGGWTRKHPTVK